MTEENSPARHGFDVDYFRFSGQAPLEAWTHRQRFKELGQKHYHELRGQRFEFVLLTMRNMVQAFPTYQRRPRMGRPAADERGILLGLLIRQFLDAKFDGLESQMRVFAPFLGLGQTFDESTYRKHNASHRMTHLLDRFHAWILAQLPVRKAVIATDATGKSTRKEVWRGTPHDHRAGAQWTKIHCAVEVPQMLVLSAVETPGRTHDSKAFEELWDKLPDNVNPIRSLADKGYVGQGNAEVAKRHGATPIHHIKDNAKWCRFPRTEFEKMVRFQRQFPNRSRELRAQRSIVETNFSVNKQLTDDRLRTRNPIAKRNDGITGRIAQNLHTLTTRAYVTAA